MHIWCAKRPRWGDGGTFRPQMRYTTNWAESAMFAWCLRSSSMNGFRARARIILCTFRHSQPRILYVFVRVCHDCAMREASSPLTVALLLLLSCVHWIIYDCAVFSVLCVQRVCDAAYVYSRGAFAIVTGARKYYFILPMYDNGIRIRFVV